MIFPWVANHDLNLFENHNRNPYAGPHKIYMVSTLLAHLQNTYKFLRFPLNYFQHRLKNLCLHYLFHHNLFSFFL
ncbi:unnamed protein product [Meloidogyne enterolobii]|uniref:Uncharacterized protein n=1 Tax=Meloidogyne enterolobii TaxID=390850 RepID=A0ACB0XP48_MELEN